MKFVKVVFFVFPFLLSVGHSMSPYVHQVKNKIKSLSREDLRGLKSGHGTPFGGMAKAAELNGLPGPRHVLDLKGELGLTLEQIKNIEGIYKKMNEKAVKVGRELVAKEAFMDREFQEGRVNPKNLEQMVNDSAQKYSQLRYIHLVAHLETAKVLQKKQVDQYNELRGYTSGDPCKNIPKGHPPAMWKKHHGCE